MRKKSPIPKGSTLGAVLGAAMDERSHRQEDAAEYLGVTQTTVSKWLRGTQLPAGEQFVALMEYLHIDAEELIETLSASYSHRVAREVWAVVSVALHSDAAAKSSKR